LSALTNPFIKLLSDPSFLEGREWSRTCYQANEVVFPEGEDSECLYVVLSGTVRIACDVELSDTRVMKPGFCDLGENDFFGEMGLFSEQVRSASAMVIDGCELACIDGDVMRRFMVDHPETGYTLMKHMFNAVNSRLRRSNERLGSIFAWGIRAHGIDKEL